MEVKLKKVGFLIIALMIAVFMIPKKVSADMFDKPTAEIEVIGINQPYRFEILIQESIYEFSEEQLELLMLDYYDDNYPLEILKDYQDDDGFVARTLYSRSGPGSLKKVSDNVYKVGYRIAPETFKIMIILEDNTIITSKIINRKLFHSEMKFDLTGVSLDKTQHGVGKVNEIIPYGHMSWRFVVRVIFTILLELFVLFLFRYKLKSSYKIVGITNLVTQTLLTLFMFIGYYFWAAAIGLFIVLLLGEGFVFISEMVFYSRVLKEKNRVKAANYAIVANLVTFLVSFLTLWFI